MEKKSYKSWTISDTFWEAVKDEIAQRQRAEGKTYKRKPGGRRKPMSKRRVLEGIFYVLRTGCQWKAVPKEYGAASSIHQYFQEWTAAGLFERIWSKGLEKYALLPFVLIEEGSSSFTNQNLRQKVGYDIIRATNMILRRCILYGCSMDYYPCVTDIFYHSDFDFGDSGTDHKKKWKRFCKKGF